MLYFRGPARVAAALLAWSSCAQAGSAVVRQLESADEEQAYLSNIVQLTSQEMGLFKSGEAYFSPDQKTIIFQAFPTGRDAYQIYTLDLPTGDLNMVSTGKGACTCAYFRPDGKKIIFASSHLSPTPQEELAGEGGYAWHFDPGMDIFEANPDGSALRRLTSTHGYDAECAYSPDGKSIVFCSNRDGDLEIYTMTADGSDVRRLTHADGYDGGPFFSPDGKTVLYRGDRRDDGKMNLQIRMVDVDGSNDRAITDNPIFNWCPYWHPSGKFFIFTQTDHASWSRGQAPNYDLFLMSRDGKKTLRITYDKEFDGLPVFSPDGRKLMWTSKRGGLDEAQVFMADFAVPEEFK